MASDVGVGGRFRVFQMNTPERALRPDGTIVDSAPTAGEYEVTGLDDDGTVRFRKVFDF